MGSRLDQKLKLWVCPVFVKIRVFQNALNGFCTAMWTCDQNFSSISPRFMDLLPQQSKKNVPNWVLNQKKSLFFPSKVESSRYPEAGTWHPESIDGWSYFRQCENFWWPLGLAPEGNLDSVPPSPPPPQKKKKFFFFFA